MSGITYATREMVQRALKFADSPRLNSRIDSGCRAGARQLEGFLHRRFYPTYDTRGFDIPDTESLWLYQHELAGAPSAITSGGTAMASTDYILKPESGPPYKWIDIDHSGVQSWEAGNTWQRAILISGPFGYCMDEDPAGELAAGINDSATALTVDDSSLAGVGDLLRAGDERMIVTGKAYVSTGITLSADLSDSKAATAATVSDGTGISAGENIQIGTERMFVEAVTGNVLTVTRGEAGSVLAAHVSTDLVWAPRRLTVVRGQVGTEAEAHSGGAPLWRNVAPALITEANLALAINYVGQAAAGYANTRGTQETARGNAGRGIEALLEECYTAYGRKTRSRAV